MKNLIYERREEIGILKINRPQVHNALNRATLEELLQFLKTIPFQDKLKGLILTGVGDKSFVSGADIKEMSGMNEEEIEKFFHLGQEVISQLEMGPFISISAINGYAFGGGLELALGTDFIYASKEAKLGFPEVKLGLIPSFGGTQRFPRAVGIRLAKELIFSGKTFTAEFGKKIGLINHLSDGKILIEDCFCALREIIKNPFNACLKAKDAIDQSFKISLVDGLDLEKRLSLDCFGTSAAKEKVKEWG